jgi:hypothetical protein
VRRRPSEAGRGCGAGWFEPAEEERAWIVEDEDEQTCPLLGRHDCVSGNSSAGSSSRGVCGELLSGVEARRMASRSSQWLSRWAKSRRVKLLGSDRTLSRKRNVRAPEPVHFCTALEEKAKTIVKAAGRLTYLVLLQDLAERDDLGIDKARQVLDLILQLQRCPLVLGKPPLALQSRGATSRCCATQKQAVDLVREIF